ncbi:MAG: M1 family metallopeptidase [Gemmatimonadota bacterium]
MNRILEDRFATGGAGRHSGDRDGSPEGWGVRREVDAEGKAEEDADMKPEEDAVAKATSEADREGRLADSVMRLAAVALLVVAGLVGEGATPLAGADLSVPEPPARTSGSIRSLSHPLLRPPTDPSAVTPWSQGVHYRIEARLDEEDDILTGRARIRYTNNSPDTLRRFYVHQHLNAFRPNSAWARADLEAGIRTFQDLGPEEHAFERIREAEIEGEAVRPFYPHAPDSTIAGLRLPSSLPPGETITVDILWDARLSTEPRRQARRGRRFDFAQWYPRVVVYDLEGWRTHPLYRQGEFYGEYATYDVTVDVAEDQVIGSTGVPLEGDPGWESVAAPGTEPVEHQRDWYGSTEGAPCVEAAGVRTCGVPGPEGAAPGSAERLGLLAGSVGAASSGRKRVRWYAEGVHHFAWSVSPEYIYEEGRFQDVVIRVLYRPGDEDTWGNGVAVERTAQALAWMDTVFGDYAYPQVTNLHRIEPGGTEFPMVIMDGSASLGLIVHEINHQYAHAILGNNEWYEGWLDEGMASFLEDWFFERRGAGRSVWLGTEAQVIDLELRGDAAPVTYPAEDYSTYGVYGSMVYGKGSLILRMLRDMAGDERMIELLRTYYDRYRLGHVDGDAFQAVAEEVLRQDLDWFFGQWLHANGVVDYALDDLYVDEIGSDGSGDDRGRRTAGSDPREGTSTARSEAPGQPGFRTTLTVERNGSMIMPVPIRLEGPRGLVKDTVVEGTGPRTEVTVETTFEPRRVELDPDGTILDWNGLNDVWEEGFLRRGGVERSLLRPLGRLPTYRDRMAAGFSPLFWANDAGGVVVGLQRRQGYLGTMHTSVLRVGAPGFSGLDRGGDSQHDDLGSLYYRVEDPIWADDPRFGTSFELLAGEGRLFGRLEREWDVSPRPEITPRRFVSAYILAADVYDPTYLISGRWNRSPGQAEGTAVEGGLGVRGIRGAPSGGWGRWEVDLTGGAGISTQAESWVRGALEGTWSRNVADWTSEARLFAGGSIGNVEGGIWDGAAVPLQRRFGLSGAGPYETLGNPWGRSGGALLEREVHHPGDGSLRGYRRDLMVDRLVTLGGELRSSARSVGPLSVSGSLFGGIGWVPELVVIEENVGTGGGAGPGGSTVTFDVVSREDDAVLGDAGVGITLGWEGAPLGLRVDAPFFVSRPAHARSARDEELGFRWAVSVVSR